MVKDTLVYMYKARWYNSAENSSHEEAGIICANTPSEVWEILHVEYGDDIESLSFECLDIFGPARFDPTLYDTVKASLLDWDRDPAIG